MQNPPQEIINQLVKRYNERSLQEALDQAQSLSKTYPNSLTVWNVLGGVLAHLGDFSGAIKAFKEVVQLKPNSFEVHNYIGVMLYKQNNLSEAVDSYKKAISFNKNYAEAHHNMGVALKDQGDLDEALVSLKKALSINPNYAEACNNIGIILQKQDKLEEAITTFKNALSINPNYTEVYNNIGTVFYQQKKFEKALESYNKAIDLNPSYGEAFNNKGLVFKAKGKLDEAEDLFRRALSFIPNYAEAYENLALIYEKQGKLDQVVETYLKVLEIKPNDENRRMQKLNQQALMCDWKGIREDSAFIPKIGTTEQSISPFMILGLEDTPARHRLRSELNAKLNHTHKPLPVISKPSKRPKRLRIGYFSADLRQHPVAYLMAKVFEKHNRENFEIYGYSINSRQEDHLRERLVKSFDVFNDVQDFSDKDAALLARQDQIDIAIDLTGYMFNSRPGIFAYRAAPIQINYLGYPGTMGADYIDYMIADEVLIPPSLRQNYSEKIIYLPNSYMATDNTLQIDKATPSRSELGLPEESFVFCAINNSYKYSAKAFEIWMRLLKNVDKSVLWLLETNKWAKENLIAECVSHGVDPKRIIFTRRVEHDKYLAQFRQADLFIDTFVYNAGATACNALWAGLPVVTKSGQGYTARMATSLLTAIGLPELITNTDKEYEDLIMELALNPKRLSSIQKQLAENRLVKPLFDSELFIQHLEKGYQQVYQRFFDGLPNQTIFVDK